MDLTKLLEDEVLKLTKVEPNGSLGQGLKRVGLGVDALVSTPKTYSVRGFWSLAKMDLPELEYLWNGIAMIPDQVVEFIGPPSIGKSRIVGDLARHQILGRDFGGRPTLKTPVKWLFAGTENGINRLERESKAFLLNRAPSEVRGFGDEELLALAEDNGFSRRDVQLLEDNFRTFTLEQPEDFDISMKNEDNIRRLTATLSAERPRIVALDPWGDVIAGKELDDGDVRETIRILRGCLAEAGLKDSFFIVINHARMGAREMALARGTDEGNFGKNSKCLYSISRNVQNIRPASLDDSSLVEIINAKNNDGQKAAPLALKLHSESMSYKLVEGFDHDDWQRTLEEAAGIKPTSSNCGKTQTDKDKIWTAIEEVLAQVEESVLGREDLIAILQNNYYIGKTAAENYIRSCVNVGKTLEITPKMKADKEGCWGNDGNKRVYGKPEAIKEYKSKHPKGGRCS